MQAAIVTIGDEILIGQITDTNSAYLAQQLDRIGIGVTEMRSIADQADAITQTLTELQDHFDVVLITGGLGPTKDDITKKTLCAYFNDQLVRNPEVEAHVIALIERVMKRPASQINKDQALVPSQATVLFNQVGTAPGMWMRKGRTVFVSLPGVPYEMKHIWTHELQPLLIKTFERPFIVHQTVLTYGQGESLVAERIEAWEDALPSCIKLAYLPSPGRVRLRLSARGTDLEVLQKALAEQIAALQTLIGDIIVGLEETDTLEVRLGRLLTEKSLTLAVAESCTGGKIAEMLTAIPGASAYFKGGMVTYTAQAKHDWLNVPESTLQQGVVSEATALAMAQGMLERSGADWAIATTGNAGPSQGDESQEVGTVCIAWASKAKQWSQTFAFGQPREKVILRAASEALQGLYAQLNK